MPRFVILHHDWPAPHFDLMLEAGTILRTWRLSERPAAGTEIAGERIGDHRLTYLDYEGPVRGGRGKVSRLDAGTYFIVDESASRLAIQLTGNKISGMLTVIAAESIKYSLPH